MAVVISLILLFAVIKLSSLEDSLHQTSAATSAGGAAVPSPAPPAETPQQSSSSFYTTERPVLPRMFVFVIGAEGTGSTWLSRLVPADHRPTGNIHKGIAGVMHKLWSDGPLEQVLVAQQGLVEALKTFVPRHRRISVLHASAPDWDSLHYPDIHSSLWQSFYQANLTLRILVTCREAAAAAHSNYRRNWRHLRLNGKHDIARSARSTEKHMSLLTSQLQSLPHPQDVLVVCFRNMLQQPALEASRMAAYLRLTKAEAHRLTTAMTHNRRKPSNYTKSLSASQLGFLTEFFDAERRSKWSLLPRLCML